MTKQKKRKTRITKSDQIEELMIGDYCTCSSWSGFVVSITFMYTISIYD